MTHKQYGGKAASGYASVLEQTCASLPFGDQLACSDSIETPNTLHYTGKERDTESGLDYMDARYYGSTMGRFMSPDPLGGHTEDPQTLNRYAYARNNPLIYTDTTGLDFNLDCAKNNGTTCQGGNTYYKDGNGDYQKTVIKSDDKGNLSDQSGNKYSGTFDGKTSLSQVPMVLSRTALGFRGAVRRKVSRVGAT
jgi:RHS repeat-associated protein